MKKTLHIALLTLVGTFSAYAQHEGHTMAPTKATVVIDGSYKPSTIHASVGQPVELTFVRKEKSGCGDILVFDSLHIRKTIKSGAKVVIRFTPKKAGDISFHCGHGMYKGTIMVM